MKRYSSRRTWKTVSVILLTIGVVGLIGIFLEANGGYITSWYNTVKDLLSNSSEIVSSLV